MARRGWLSVLIRTDWVGTRQLRLHRGLHAIWIIANRDVVADTGSISSRNLVYLAGNKTVEYGRLVNPTDRQRFGFQKVKAV